MTPQNNTVLVRLKLRENDGDKVRKGLLLLYNMITQEAITYGLQLQADVVKRQNKWMDYLDFHMTRNEI